MKFKTFYSGSLDESKKNMRSYQKSYDKYFEKFKNIYSDSKLTKQELDQKIVDNIFKKMMEDGWTKQEIHMYK